MIANRRHEGIIVQEDDGGYLDAGSGSLVASALAAGGSGFLVLIKMGFKRFVSIFSPKRRRKLAEERAAASKSR
jgi:hypothetical protein